MRVKTLPRQHLSNNRVRYGNVIDCKLSNDSRISQSEPCLRFTDDFEFFQRTMARHQGSTTRIDEALDLALPNRTRCHHERYNPCFSLEKNFVSASSADQLEAIDLSIRSQMEKSETSTSCTDFKQTFLYKMLTDSLFLENLRKIKQSVNHVCPYCKQKFAKEDDLTDHLNVRMDESNQVACCACGKTFAQKRYLRYHQRCHSERNKFTCDICTKNYSRLDNLTRHNIFHTNPDKFPCTLCERTFARKDLLKKHLKCHENRHRYHCSTCDKYFKGPLSLENHKKLFHTNA